MQPLGDPVVAQPSRDADQHGALQFAVSRFAFGLLGSYVPLRDPFRHAVPQHQMPLHHITHGLHQRAFLGRLQNVAVRAGAHGYILKTTEEGALVQAVRDVMKGHLVLGHGVAERVAQRYVAPQQAEGEATYGELERAVLVGIAAGLSNDRIAERLHLAPPIVDRQVKELLERLRVSSRIEAAMIALREGVIHLDDVHTMLGQE